MTPMLAIAAALLGVGLFAYAVALRLGRSPLTRSWADGSERQVGNATLLLPGAGLGLVAGVAIMQCAGRSSALDAVLVLAFVGFVVLSLYAGLQFRVPLWALPRWSRDSISRRRQARR